MGSHKTNSAVAQAYYNSTDGVRKLTTETGAGQWGSALSYAGAQFGLEIEVWQVRASYESKPYRGHLMRTYGGTVHSSPSTLTEAGRAILVKDPNTTGSLGMAVSEAVEVAAADPEARYALGSVLNHVVLHQTVIGQEAVAQLALVEADGVDAVFGCAGGGSNLAGLSFPFLREKIHGRSNLRIVAAEPAACPLITEGEYRYDHGDVAGLTPLLKMHTLGMGFVPDPIHAGGLRYHGMAPALSHTVELGLVEGWRSHSTTRSLPVCSLRAGRASCPLQNRRMPSPRRPSMSRTIRGSRWWSSGCPGTASSICRPSRNTSTASSDQAVCGRDYPRHQALLEEVSPCFVCGRATSRSRRPSSRSNTGYSTTSICPSGHGAWLGRRPRF